MKPRKLVLSRQTLQALNPEEATGVAGGIYTLWYQCNTQGLCIPRTEWNCPSAPPRCL